MIFHWVCSEGKFSSLPCHGTYYMSSLFSSAHLIQIRDPESNLTCHLPLFLPHPWNLIPNHLDFIAEEIFLPLCSPTEDNSIISPFSQTKGIIILMEQSRLLIDPSSQMGTIPLHDQEWCPLVPLFCVNILFPALGSFTVQAARR